MEHHVKRLARHVALGRVEHDLRPSNPDLDFYLVGQARYGQSGFAFIEVRGGCRHLNSREKWIFRATAA